MADTEELGTEVEQDGESEPEIWLETSSDGPVLVVGGTQILLRAHTVDHLSDRGFSSGQSDVTTEVDQDKYEFWVISREDGHSYIEIDPEVIEGVEH